MQPSPSRSPISPCSSIGSDGQISPPRSTAQAPDTKAQASHSNFPRSWNVSAQLSAKQNSTTASPAAPPCHQRRWSVACRTGGGATVPVDVTIQVDEGLDVQILLDGRVVDTFIAPAGATVRTLRAPVGTPKITIQFPGTSTIATQGPFTVDTRPCFAPTRPLPVTGPTMLLTLSAYGLELLAFGWMARAAARRPKR